MGKPRSTPGYPWPWPMVRRRVLDEENWTCRICGKHARSVDHIVAVSERPDLMFDRSNLQALCTACNSRKELQRREWLKRVDRRPANRRTW